ncbi:MAG: exopolysaccharide biosynthesis polyprenyl glycosylphosphotransferase [Opitutaceae bacterium]|nr:exopolysaccharide biosynthesis polyprenyl glycosylphosphotransferase [Opitutaceae bacterium]
MPRPANPLRETVLPLTLLAGDTLAAFGGLSLGYWFRYESALAHLGVEVPDASFRTYLPLLLLGVALLIVSFAQFGLYDTRLLLRRYQSLNVILKGAAFWLVAYLGVSLVLKFDPPISRLFVMIAFVCVVAVLGVWRSLAYRVIARPALAPKLRRRVALLGWNEHAAALAAEIARDPAHPFALVGVIALDDSDRLPLFPPLPVSPSSAALAPLGDIRQLDAFLAQHAIDVLILTRADLPRADVQRIVEVCERAYVEWKIVPGAFDIFLSGLHLQTIGRVPVLGVEELAIRRLFNRALKRLVDVVGALVGLAVSAPLIALLAALIKRESPDGPVFFGQQRVGAGHRPITMWKLRSMAPDAAATDTAQQSTARGDPRLLRIGAFLRRWNLDELPQFWNVLRGEMSLVGPRPERPYHVDRLSSEIPHYLPRHLAKPGMTGWAQVNGLRGDTDLAARVQHDIYYIENWSLWLDVQIMLLTFVRWRSRNAY